MDTKEQITLEKYISENGFAVHSVKGVSMLPLIDEKTDAVRLVKLASEPKIYDIVLFKRKNGELVLHRIVGIKKDGYLIRGDNCIKGEFVTRGQIIALAQGIYKNGEYKPCSDREIASFGTLQKRTLHFRILRAYIGFLKKALTKT